jgi:hypothetical protein
LCLYFTDTEDDIGLERFRKSGWLRRQVSHNILIESGISKKLFKLNEIRMHEIRKGKHLSAYFPFIIDENKRMLYPRFFLISFRMCH